MNGVLHSYSCIGAMEPSFHAFRLATRDRLTEAILVERGTLRPSQLRFLRDALRHYCLPPACNPAHPDHRHQGFFRHFVGSGKTVCATLVCLGLLYHAPHHRPMPKTLLTVPSDEGRQDLLRFLQSPERLVALFGLSVAEADTFALHVFSYRSGSCKPGSVDAHEFASAWVIVATPQSLSGDVGYLREDEFTELVVDEADYGMPGWIPPRQPLFRAGSVRTPQATEHSWCTIAERLTGLRCLVLQSATQNRSDGIPLPPAFSVYSFEDALRDRVVKMLRVYYLVPSGKCSGTMTADILPQRWQSHRRRRANPSLSCKPRSYARENAALYSSLSRPSRWCCSAPFYCGWTIEGLAVFPGNCMCCCIIPEALH